MEYTITVLPQNQTLTVARGSNLLSALVKAGLAPEAPCGGNGKCGKCTVTVNGEPTLACRYRVESDLTVALPAKSADAILSQAHAGAVTPDPLGPGYPVAVDIGTTTVVCYLLSPEGQELAVASMRNPQAPFGADVISRIRKALEGELEALTGCIRAGVSQLILDCCRQAEIAPDQIGVVSIVGNPCMQQLFLGISPQNLAAIPFAPVLTRAEILPAGACLPPCPQALLLTIPDLSGYVGADTLGCVLASELYRTEETVLLVDIGTNGEMVLAHRGQMAACSTAAGPALEGANIRFGMRGAAGAIDHVWQEGGQLRCSVIGQIPPTGICGSGIIDAVAVLLDQGVVNRRGRIRPGEEAEGQRVAYLSENIYLTQEDIRQVQMAKGAIAAGVHLLCRHFAITPEAIDRVLLAGAFGSFLNPESACKIGLLPQCLLEKITACGNLAGAGAKRAALNREQFALTQKLLDRIHFLELAQLPDFSLTFAQCMGFSPPDPEE